MEILLIVWDVTPCNMVEVYRRLGGTYCLRLQGRRQAKNATRKVASTLKMVEVRSFETSVNVYYATCTTYENRTEDSIFEGHRRWNLKYHIRYIVRVMKQYTFTKGNFDKHYSPLCDISSMI